MPSQAESLSLQVDADARVNTPPAAVTTAQGFPGNWGQINWTTHNQEVQRLQQRIFRATQAGQWRQVRDLQRLLLRSQSNLILAVRQITHVNPGRKAPGVDGQVALRAPERMVLIARLQGKAQRAKPARRVDIPKADGKRRPLGIPTIEDRVRQAIVKTALEPSWEARFEASSYGFRPGRSAHDAVAKLFNRLNGRTRGKWVLDADIRGAFDNISHDYILTRLGNFPAKRQIKEWLKAGYLEQDQFFSTETDTPQGGVISPLLANVTLDGMERLFDYPRYDGRQAVMGYARYADDLVITSPTRELLEKKLPEIRAYLAERGLELNEEKTRIVHIKDGFDFLGFTVRQHDGKLLIKPQKEKVIAKLREWRAWLRAKPALPQEAVIRYLNLRIREWSLYYRHVTSAEVLSYTDHQLFRMLWSWVYRRHPHKPADWRKRRYYRQTGDRKWVFATTVKRRGRDEFLPLAHVPMPIVRHVPVEGRNSPMDPALQNYWIRRWSKQAKLLDPKATADGKNWQCKVCGQPLTNGEPLDKHHLTSVRQDGSQKLRNLELRHEACHYNAHGPTRT